MLKVAKAAAVALFKALGYNAVTSWTDDQLIKKVQKLPELYDGRKVADKDAKKLLDKIVAAVEAGDNIVLEGGKAPAKVVAPAKGGKSGKKPAPAPEPEPEEEEEEENEENEEEEEESEEDDEDAEPEEEEETEEEETDEDESEDEDDETESEEEEEETPDEDETESEEDDESEEETEDEESEDEPEEEEETEDEEEEEVEAPAKAPAKKGGKASASKPAATTPAKTDGKGKLFPKSAGGDGKPGVIASIKEFLSAASKDNPITKKAILAKLVKRFKDRTETGMSQTLNIQLPGRLRAAGMDIRKDAEGKGFWVAKGAKKAAATE